jgi:hypothetical protein
MQWCWFQLVSSDDFATLKVTPAESQGDLSSVQAVATDIPQFPATAGEHEGHCHIRSQLLYE